MCIIKDEDENVLTLEESKKIFDKEYEKINLGIIDSDYPITFCLYLYKDKNSKENDKTLDMNFSSEWAEITFSDDTLFDWFEISVKGKKEIHRIIEKFFNDDINDLKNNYIEKWKKTYKNLEIPDFIILLLNEIKSSKKIEKIKILEKLKKILDIKKYSPMRNHDLIKSEIIFEKIETYIKENNIENIYFKNREEIKGQENVIKFFKENLVIPY